MLGIGDKRISIDEVKQKLKSAKIVMIGGFGDFGRPNKILEILSKCDGLNWFRVVTNDPGTDDGILPAVLCSGCAESLLCSFSGMSKKTPAFFGDRISFMPQGDLVEAIRCAAVGAESIRIFGKDIAAIRADLAIIKADKSDLFGNLSYRGNAMNFNHVMAMAAEYTIAEVDEICKIEPDRIHTPGVFIDAVFS